MARILAYQTPMLKLDPLPKIEERGSTQKRVGRSQSQP